MYPSKFLPMGSFFFVAETVGILVVAAWTTSAKGIKGILAIQGGKVVLRQEQVPATRRTGSRSRSDVHHCRVSRDVDTFGVDDDALRNT
jgi:hypothetical protein